MSNEDDQLKIELAQLRRTLQIMASRPGPCPCIKCGHEVEPDRRAYVLPTCYACLPPLEPSAAEERERIVAWLRARGPKYNFSDQRELVAGLSKMIEAGEHCLKKESDNV